MTRDFFDAKWFVGIMDANKLEKAEETLDLCRRGINVFQTISSFIKLQPCVFTKLDLSENHLRSISDDEIGCLSNLIALDLSSNQLQYLPCGLCKLSKLKTLLVRNNVLYELPKCMTSSQSLEILNVSGNRIQHFPVEVLQLSRLKQLHLGGNYIQNIPKDITRLIR